MSEQRERGLYTFRQGVLQGKSEVQGERRNNSVQGRGKRTETERKDMVVEEGAEPEKV